MALRKYEIASVFHYEGYFIDLTVGTIQAQNKQEANKIGETFDKGVLYYDSKAAKIIHELNGEMKELGNHNINHCEVLEPRIDIEHTSSYGRTFYEREDYRRIFNKELVKELSERAIENNKPPIFFEFLAYGVIPIRKQQVETCEYCKENRATEKYAHKYADTYIGNHFRCELSYNYYCNRCHDYLFEIAEETSIDKKKSRLEFEKEYPNIVLRESIDRLVCGPRNQNCTIGYAFIEKWSEEIDYKFVEAHDSKGNKYEIKFYPVKV